MTWDEILILLIMVMCLFAIDMLVAKFNLKAGRIVAVLTFFVLFPLGLVAGIVALVCMNIKAKKKVDYKIEPITKESTGNREHATALKSNQADLERLCRIAEEATSEKRNRKKKFAMIFQNSELIGAIILSAVLLCPVDLLILTSFPEAKFPVIIFSISLFPVIVVLMMKFLDYLNDKIGMKIEEWENNPNKYRQITGVGAFEVKRKFIYEQQEKNRESENKVSDSSTSFGGYATPADDPYAVSDDYFDNDPDYQDYLQGNIRPSRYQIEHKVANNGEAYTTLKSERTEMAAYYEALKKNEDAKTNTKLVLKKGITEIKGREFKDREDFISVEIPFGVTKIGKSAFNGCCNLTSIVIPKSVTKIEEYAFFGCERLKRIYISDLKKWCEIEFGKWFSNPLYYEGNLYLNNHLMTELVIPNNMTKIKSYAFAGCAGLEKVVIHRGVTEIGEGAFGNCVNLDSVHISDLYQWCNIKFGYQANPLMHAKKLYLKNELVTKFAIPEGTKKVNDYIFAGYQELKELKIPNGVTEIGRRAFSHCTGLTELVFPDSLEKIEFEAFCGCSNLEKITFPKHMVQVVECAFYDCRKLSCEDEIKIQQNTKMIDRGDYELIMLDDGNERWVHK